MSDVKQLKYFAYEKDTKLKNVFPVTTLDDYKKHFEGAKGFKIRGESSPVYFHSPIAADRIKNTIPDVKIITCLRNPVDRAYSGYLMQLRSGKKSESIYSEFDISKDWVKLGFYYEHLRRNLSIFGEEQSKIILFDHLTSNTDETMSDLFRFLNISDKHGIDYSVHNKGYVPKSKLVNSLVTNKNIRKRASGLVPMSLKKVVKRLEEKNRAAKPVFPYEIRYQLTELYKEDILKTQELIQQDLSMWLKIESTE
jgi:hypothetical protein